MATDPLINVMSSIIANVAPISANLTYDLLQMIARRFRDAEKAEEKFIERQNTGNLDQLDNKRIQFITQAKRLNSKVLIELPIPELRQELLILLGDTINSIWLAKTDADFDTIELNFELVKANLDSYQEIKRKQKRAKDLAIVASALSVVSIASIIVLISHFAPNFDAALPLPLIGIPTYIILWSFIGSITAILYRFNLQKDVELQDPFRWLFTRPMTGIVMGMVLYLSMQVGLIAVQAEPSVNIGGVQLAWIAAFIGGFSDRLSDTLLKLLVGRFGGDSTETPLSQASAVTRFEKIDPEILRRLASSRTPVDDISLNGKSEPNTLSFMPDENDTKPATPDATPLTPKSESAEEMNTTS